MKFVSLVSLFFSEFFNVQILREKFHENTIDYAWQKHVVYYAFFYMDFAILNKSFQ